MKTIIIQEMKLLTILFLVAGISSIAFSIVDATMHSGIPTILDVGSITLGFALIFAAYLSTEE